MKIIGTIEQLEKINCKRAVHFSDFNQYQNKNILYYSSAIAGEVGEFCNLLKKMLRGDKYDRDGKTEITPELICKELADMIIYAEFITNMYGLSLSEVIKGKFNEVSINKRILHKYKLK